MKPGKPSGVAEFQGFYAPFTVTETLLQKIWMRRDFAVGRARTLSGEPVEIRFPGKWNRLEGPDFQEARLRIGEREITGDVELHFHAADWLKHGHEDDPNYDRVVLHVLLFAPKAGEPGAVTASGRRPPAMALLEILHHDLEEYAAEDMLERTLEREHWQATEDLLVLPLAERRELLGRHARLRWERKIHYAKVRIAKLGWREACHQTAMEILGYRRNRAAMIHVATRFPLETWEASVPGEEELFAAGSWIRRGARPANHPRRRLRQYLQWVEARPDWPERLRETLAAQAGAAPGFDRYAARPFRTACDLGKCREAWAREICGGVVGGTRLDTLFCDGFLPLIAADAGGGDRFFGYWFSWYAGDFPDRVLGTLRTAEIVGGSGYTNCNGFCQGVLSLSLEKRNDPLACFEEE